MCKACVLVAAYLWRYCLELLPRWVKCFWVRVRVVVRIVVRIVVRAVVRV